MTPTQGSSPLRSFRIALLVILPALAAAGVVYGRILGLPAGVLAPILAAFLWEASFYLVPGFPALWRAMAERWRPPVLALGLIGSTAAPYCTYTLPAGLFQWSGLGLILSISAAAALCYLCLPRNGRTDAVFLVFMAAVVLTGAFRAIYPSPAPGVRLEILGQLMWTRTGILVMLWFRHMERTGFGFVPTRAEWVVGLRNYLYFLPVGLPLALATGLVRFRPLPLEWWQALGVAAATFLGMLWVVALGEEFFFRGVMQGGLTAWLGSRTAALVVTSVAFGLVHLPFRGFPNWRFALVAGVAGLFYGRAFQQAGGIRAAMITHALVNTTWRSFFT
ncbi:MAG: CPBP family intramembrane metalloprotease [Bryobacterales bacterium]|nr:CPBP family intramembrane metalloprotease [Bryobacterales bacterium]